MNPKLTVIIPVYCAEGTLNRAVDSVINQTMTDFELILIDDGSPDSSGALCDQLAANDDRIKVIHQKNAGPGNARNRGIEIAKGEFIAFLDADDWIEPEAYQVLYNIAVEHSIDIAMCGYVREFYKDNQKKSESYNICPQAIINNKTQFIQHFNDLYINGYIHSLWNKIYRTSVIKNNNIRLPEHINLGEDLFFNVEVLKTTVRIGLTDHILYHYVHESSQSLSQKYNKDHHKINVLLYNHVHKFIEKIISECDPMSYYKLCNMAHHDMYLRACFISMERILSKNGFFPPKKILEDIKAVMNCQETSRAVTAEGSKASIEFAIYRMILKTRECFIVILFTRLRLAMKKMMRG